MTTPIERVRTDLKGAMREQDKTKLGTLRMLLTEAKNTEIATSQQLDDDGMWTVVKRLVKQRRDSAEQYRKGDREELAVQEEAEIEVLEAYLPKQATEAEIRAKIEHYVAANDLTGPQSMGAVMGAVMAELGATADGKTVSRIARDVLTASP